MPTDENVKNDRPAAIEDRAREKSEGGLRINTDVKAGGITMSD